MTDISEAIAVLENYGIEAFDVSSILVIPVNQPEEIYPMADKARRIFKEINYEKSWRIDPYYYEKRQTVSGEMFLNA